MTYNRETLSADYNNVVEALKKATPNVLHVNDSVERFLRDMEEADEDFNYTLEDFIVHFNAMWWVYQNPEG